MVMGKKSRDSGAKILFPRTRFTIANELQVNLYLRAPILSSEKYFAWPGPARAATASERRLATSA